MIGKNFGKECEGTIEIEKSWGTTKDRTKPLQETITTSKNRRMGWNPWIICTHAYMHTCIQKANIFFSGKFNKADLHEMGARYTVFCGSQELKPPRHEESKGRRSRQRGEPRLKILGARPNKRSSVGGEAHLEAKWGGMKPQEWETNPRKIGAS